MYIGINRERRGEGRRGVRGGQSMGKGQREREGRGVRRGMGKGNIERGRGGRETE